MRGICLSVTAYLLVAACFAATANGETIRADRSDSLYLGLGAQSQYASVGRLDIAAANGNYIGSGTLIAPQWVITAAHCVDQAQSLIFTDAGKSYSASNWVAFPSWNGNLTAGNDIALVHLSSAVSGVTPATRYAGATEIGQVGTFVGYGMTGTGLTGATTFDGQKRGGQNMIDAYYQSSRKSVNTNLLLADFDNPNSKRDNLFGAATPLNLEAMIAPGDSGGGLFVTVGSQTYLAGVNSFGGAVDGLVNSDYGDFSGDTRVSAFNTWIDSVMRSLSMANVEISGAADPAPDAKTNGLTFVPEPTTMSLLALGGIGALLRRRKS